MGKKSHKQFFRLGAGAIITRPDGLVLLLERKDTPGAWQFPQGGLKEGETPLQAAEREIFEETGITPDRLSLLAQETPLLAYELPEPYRSKKIGWGQVHYWFLFLYSGADGDITLGEQQEFVRWKWASMDEAVAGVVGFKQPVYRQLAEWYEEHHLL